MDVNQRKLAWTLSCLTALSGCSSFYSGKEYSALQINPVMNVRHADTSAENLYLLGRYHHRKTSYANAIATYQRALAVNPDYVEAHNGLGVVYASQGQHALALEHFQKAIELTPAATYLYNNLGYAYLIQEHYSEAAAAFQEALHYDPHNQKASRNLATTRKRMGLSEQAAISSAITAMPQKPEKTVATAPQPSAVQPNTNQQQLMQLAPNIYEFRNDQEKPRIVPIATSTAAPIAASVTASATISPIHPTPIAHDLTAKTASESTVAAAPPQRIEVSNGNGVTGMARNIATFLKQFGFDNSRLTNHQTFQQAETEIHFHPSAHALAEQISQIMPSQVRMVESDQLREDIQLKILLGKDIASEIAFFTNQGKVQLAQHTTENMQNRPIQ